MITISTRSQKDMTRKPTSTPTPTPPFYKSRLTLYHVPLLLLLRFCVVVAVVAVVVIVVVSLSPFFLTL